MGVKYTVFRFGKKMTIEAPHPAIESCKCGKIGFLILQKPLSKAAAMLRKKI